MAAIQYGSVTVTPNRFWHAELTKRSAFDKGRLAAESMRIQRYALKKASEAIKRKDFEAAAGYLYTWKTERKYHAHILGLI